MDNYQCGCCRPSCSLLTLLVSIAIGIAFGVFAILEILTPEVAAIIAIAASIILFIITFFATIQSRGSECVCRYISRILSGIAGSLLLGILTLFLIDVLEETLLAIFAGVTFFALSLAVTALFCIILCLCESCSDCDCM